MHAYSWIFRHFFLHFKYETIAAFQAWHHKLVVHTRTRTQWTWLFCYISFIFRYCFNTWAYSRALLECSTKISFHSRLYLADVISLLFALFLSFFKQNKTKLYTVHWLIACVRVFQWNRQQKYFCVKDNIYYCWYNIWWWFHHVEIIMNIDWRIWRRKNNNTIGNSIRPMI